MCYVYLLICADGTLYCGATKNIEKRLKRHRSGKGAKYVASRLPVEVFYVEESKDWATALRREYAIKQMSRQKKLGLVVMK